MKNIFVGNLDFRETEDSIRSLFEPHGTVERVSLVTDRETGRSRGFAFIEMTNPDEADRAISALNVTDSCDVSSPYLWPRQKQTAPAGQGNAGIRATEW